MTACPFMSIGNNQSRRAVRLSVSCMFTLFIDRRFLTAFEKFSATSRGGMIILESRRVLIRIPLKILPVELFVAAFTKDSQ